MGFAYHALVFDYDGTLTQGARPEPAVLEALARARASGRKLVLATGRILRELVAEFPDVEQHFDALVLENGAVVRTALGHRLVIAPVDLQLDAALTTAGISFRRGEAIVATGADAAPLALAALARLGLDCQLVRNREELMILPAGVSKGTGAREALGDLGISYHCAIAVGDAENDLALIEACELSVAVSNAVDALKTRVDVVLTAPGAQGIAALIDGPLVRGERSVRSRRWQVELGDGARIPGSGVNVLVAGDSGSGKSYLAGLFAERLVQLGYSICVLDPEGDYEALGHLRGVRVVGGTEPLPAPSGLAAAVRHRFGSLVVDLSHLPYPERQQYVADALRELQLLREQTGAPHWILLDEAHLPLAEEPLPIDPAQKGLCLVTYLPQRLALRLLEAVDVFLLPLSKTNSVAAELLEVAGVRALPALPSSGSPSRLGLLVDGRGATPIPFRMPLRCSPHVRHWHKYMSQHLPEQLGFIFRGPHGEALCTASNVSELHHDLVGVPGASIAHHASRGDLSRWAREALQDPTLAEGLAAAERCLAEGTPKVRQALLDAVERRYIALGPTAPPKLAVAR